jgi:hypothetical protein
MPDGTVGGGGIPGPTLGAQLACAAWARANGGAMRTSATASAMSFTLNRR